MTNRCTVCGKVIEEDRTHICWTAINAASPPIVNGLPSPQHGSTGDAPIQVASGTQAVTLAALTSLLTFDELLALIVTQPDFDFIDWMYIPDGKPKWRSTAFFSGARDGSVEGEGETKEEAMYFLFLRVVSGAPRFS